MKLNLPIILILLMLTPTSHAQDLSVPDSILSELEAEVFLDVENKYNSFAFRIAYPENYDSTKTYPVFLTIAGGDQSLEVVDYCYAAWFRSKYFNDYITILPINTMTEKNLSEISKVEILNMFKCIKTNFNVTEKKWIIAGTSNGGVATFNFISAQPSLFDGAIVIPGTIGKNCKITSSWKHLKFVLACGDQDSEDWKTAVAESAKTLLRYTNEVRIVTLKNQGHILPIGFEIDEVYKTYFEMQN